MSDAPNCFQCAHYHVTWDKRFPNGCTKFGMKCKQIPSVEVLVTTGKQCIFFIQKGQSAEESEPPLRDHSTFTTEA